MTKKEIDVQIALGTITSEKIEKLFMEELKQTVKPITIDYNKNNRNKYVKELNRVAKETEQFYTKFSKKYSKILDLNSPDEDSYCEFMINTTYCEDWTVITLLPLSTIGSSIDLTVAVQDYLNIDYVLTVGLYSYGLSTPWKENSDS